MKQVLYKTGVQFLQETQSKQICSNNYGYFLKKSTKTRKSFADACEKAPLPPNPPPKELADAREKAPPPPKDPADDSANAPLPPKPPPNAPAAAREKAPLPKSPGPPKKPWGVGTGADRERPSSAARKM